VAASRRRVGAAWAALWPRDRWEALRIGFGTAMAAAMLVGLALALAPHGSPPDGVAERTGDETPVAAAPLEVPPTIDALPDGPPDPTPTQGMTQALDIDPQTDPRPACDVHGAVEWQPGRLTLGPDGSLRRVLDLGAQVKVTLRLAFTPLTEDGQTSMTRFAFQIRERGEFVASLVRRLESGKTVSELRLVDHDTPYRGEKVTRTLRTFEWKGDVPEGPWTFRCHHGLLTVYCGEKRMGVAYAEKEPGQSKDNPDRQPPAKDNRDGQPPVVNRRFYELFGVDEPLEVSGWSLEQQGTSVACLEASGNAAPSYRTTQAPSFAEKDRATRREFGSPYGGEQSDLRARIDHPIVPLLLGTWENDHHRHMIRECLGQHHPYYALALQGGAMQHHWGFMDDVAQQLLEQAVAIGEESLGPWHPDCISANLSLGRLYREVGKFERAEPLLTTASKSTGEVFGKQNYRYAQSLQELALLAQYTARFADAETLLRRAAEASKDAPPRDRANALSALGVLEARVGEREKAAALLGQALETLERLAQEASESFAKDGQSKHWLVFVDLANTRVQRGWILFRDGQEEQARQLARSSFLDMVQFFDAFNGRPDHFNGWNSEMRNVIPNGFMTSHPAYGRVMIALADLFIALGDYNPARSCVSLADNVSLNFHTRHDAAVLYRTTAKLYEKFPNLELGLWQGHLSERQRMDLCIKTLQARNDAEERERQDYIAWVQSPTSKDKMSEEEKKKWEDTGRKLRRSQAILPPGMRDKENVRKADYALDWQRIALREFEQSSGPQHPETVDVLLSQARWQWRSNGPEKAEATFHDAWDRAVELSGRVLPGLPEAQAYQFLETNRPPSDLLLSCYRATNKKQARDAYEVVWRSKALATRQLMERRQLLQATAGRPEIGKLAEELQTTRQKLAQLSLAAPGDAAVEKRRQQLADLTRRKEDLEREIARLSEPFRRTQDAGRSGVADLVRLLPAKTAVVDFVERWQWTPPAKSSEPWSRTRWYDAFVVRSGEGAPGWSAAWLSLGDASEVDRLLDDWIAGLRRGGQSDPHFAEPLRRRLWEPIEASLSDCKTVILIPDGRLAGAPWAALPGRRADSYLIEDYALGQAPYGQYVARLLMDPAPDGDGFLVVGGIDYGPVGKWGFLKGTAAEGEQLEKLRSGPKTVRLGGAAATKPRLRELLPGRRYVHLATHGEFLDPAAGQDRRGFLATDSASGGALFDVTARNPLVLSMLVLAGANRPAKTDERGLPVGSDSFLTAEEVMGLDLSRTELVVLSACETGAGKVRGDEGVFSLQRAFHVAGSRAVMATHWQVHDESSRRLMLSFYRNLWDERRPMGKLEALRAAQLEMIGNARYDADSREVVDLRGGEKVADPEARRRLEEQLARLKKSGEPLPPFYWAAFVLSGDWR
jgi:CHAT domain-containing protein/tetratricopeptide (TPR) repeat protein